MKIWDKKEGRFSNTGVFHFLITLITEILFLPITKHLLSVLNCTYFVESAENYIGLTIDLCTKCWTKDNDQPILALIAMIATGYYFIFGVAAFAETSDRATFFNKELDVQFTPLFIAVERLIKVVLLAVTTFISTRPPTSRAVPLFGISALFILLHVMQSCKYKSVVYWRKICYLLCFWASVTYNCTSFMTTTPIVNYLPASLLFTGWIIIFVVSFVIYKRFKAHDDVFFSNTDSYTGFEDDNTSEISEH